MSNLKPHISQLNVTDWEPEVFITKELQAQISMLHHTFGKVEWSGYILYNTEGSIKDKNLRCIGHKIYLMDLGDLAFTSFESTDAINIMTDVPEFTSKNYRMGFVHTH